MLKNKNFHPQSRGRVIAPIVPHGYALIFLEMSLKFIIFFPNLPCERYICSNFVKNDPVKNFGRRYMIIFPKFVHPQFYTSATDSEGNDLLLVVKRQVSKFSFFSVIFGGWGLFLLLNLVFAFNDREFSDEKTKCGMTATWRKIRNAPNSSPSSLSFHDAETFSLFRFR